MDSIREPLYSAHSDVVILASTKENNQWKKNNQAKYASFYQIQRKLWTNPISKCFKLHHQSLWMKNWVFPCLIIGTKEMSNKRKGQVKTDRVHRKWISLISVRKSAKLAVKSCESYDEFSRENDSLDPIDQLHRTIVSLTL